MQRKVAAAFVAVLTLGLASCGGGKDRLSASQFKQRANAICNETRGQATQLAGQAQGKIDRSSAKRLLAITDKGIGKLEALKPPKADEAKFAEMRRELQGERDFIASALKQSRPSPAAVRANAARGQRIGQTARELGLSGCV
jgi:hypothetical protein